MALARSDVLAIAKCEVERRGLEWREPITIDRRRRFLVFGPAVWEVLTNSNCRGRNVVLEIDDADGRILKVAWLPR